MAHNYPRFIKLTRSASRPEQETELYLNIDSIQMIVPDPSGGSSIVFPVEEYELVVKQTPDEIYNIIWDVLKG